MTRLASIGRLFTRNRTSETVRTMTRFDATPEAVWREMLFYEEVPQRPAPLLRMFLPLPLRTRGDKARVGATIACTYDGGHLEKRITAADPPRAIRFDVLEQELGIEDCISMDGGYYELTADGGGTQVVLATVYRGHLRPRWLWRPFEHYFAHRLHRHILHGMRVALDARGPQLIDASNLPPKPLAPLGASADAE